MLRDIEYVACRAFFTHSPYQVYVAELICTQFEVDMENMIVMEGDAAVKESDLWRESYKINNTNGKWFGRRFTQITKKQINSVLQQLYHNGVRQIYFSDLDWPTNNYAFRKARQLNIDCKIFEDGSGIYTPNRINASKALKMLIKVALSKIELSLYSTPVAGHYLGINQPGISEVYSMRKISDIAAENKIILRSRNTQNAPNPFSILVLDQPWKRVLNQSTFELVSSRLNDFLAMNNSQGNLQYFLKRHPRDQDGTDSFGPALDLNYRVVQSEQCAEELIPEINPGIVVSFYSTALLNIKEQYPHIRVVSIGLSRREILSARCNKVNLTDSDALFHSNGIEIIYKTR